MYEAGPRQMQAYYGAAPQPPAPLPDAPPPTQEQLDAHATAMDSYNDQKAAYERRMGPPPSPAPVSVPAAGAGKPAARMGDLTAHGGTIVQGEPTVIIAGKPAATVSHMHTCPMVTGVVPHVGGAIIPPGSATVKIGMAMLPAARVGDQCTCTGPSDTIAMGENTVLIGG